MESRIYAPMFKGIVEAPTPEGAMLLSGKNDAGDPLSGEEYIRLVRQQNTPKGSPQLVQDIARATGAAILAHNVFKQDVDPRLISVEGCAHRVGSEVLSGSEIMGRIWQNIVPGEVMAGLRPPELFDISTCTVEEVRAILALRSNATEAIVPVTDRYHRARVEQTFREEGKNVPLAVFTPAEAAHQADVTRVMKDFLRELMLAAAPSEKFESTEWWAETLLNGPLHAVSRTTENWTGFSPEITLAHILRKRVKKDTKDA